MQNNFSRETRWEYHAEDRGVNAVNTICNVFNNAWSERVDPSLVAQGTAECVAFAMRGSGCRGL